MVTAAGASEVDDAGCCVFVSVPACGEAGAFAASFGSFGAGAPLLSKSGSIAAKQ